MRWCTTAKLWAASRSQLTRLGVQVSRAAVQAAENLNHAPCGVRVPAARISAVTTAGVHAMSKRLQCKMIQCMHMRAKIARAESDGDDSTLEIPTLRNKLMAR